MTDQEIIDLFKGYEYKPSDLKVEYIDLNDNQKIHYIYDKNSGGIKDSTVIKYLPQFIDFEVKGTLKKELEQDFSNFQNYLYLYREEKLVVIEPSNKKEDYFNIRTLGSSNIFVSIRSSDIKARFENGNLIPILKLKEPKYNKSNILGLILDAEEGSYETIVYIYNDKICLIVGENDEWNRTSNIEDLLILLNLEEIKLLDAPIKPKKKWKVGSKIKLKSSNLIVNYKVSTSASISCVEKLLHNTIKIITWISESDPSILEIEKCGAHKVHIDNFEVIEY